MKSLILLTLMTFSISSYALRAPEVLYIDQADNLAGRTFLVSNSLHDGLVGIKADFKITAILDCGAGEKKLKLKKNKIKTVTIPKKASCLLKLPDDRTVTIVNDEKHSPFLKDLHDSKESCQYQTTAHGIEKLFLTNDYSDMTCANAVKTQNIEILSPSEDGLLAKMEALLGYRPDVSFIENLNPYAELDFSKAPNLDAIFVSTLLYRHDFTGAVVARLLKFHAARGTLINIVGTGYMHVDQDKALLKELSKIPNIRVQEYKYHDPRKGPAPLFNLLTNYLRDMHVKMFVTLSSESPENNVLIMGGRNIHDGFVFDKAPDLSKHPELIQNDPEAPYAYWNDLEVKVTSPKLARSVYSQLLKFWNREVVGQVMLPTQDESIRNIVSGDEVLNSPDTLIRHVMSLPFNDDQTLEKLYVEMIDKASKSIKLSSPYLRPTKKIMKAFERAIARGVDITIQTRIDLNGDTQAWLYEEANKAAINSLFDKIKIFEWKEDSILHTKLLIIDDNFTFFGSVNLSRRSFIQDVENGFLMHDRNFTSRMTEVFNGYIERSVQIEEKQKRKFWATIVMTLLQNQF